MTQTFKIFDLYEISNITIEDPGLKGAINLQPKLILKSHGRNVMKLGQIRINIVERLMNKDRKSTRLNSSHIPLSRMPSSA